MVSLRSSAARVRTLTIEDLPDTLHLSTSAGWNQTFEDCKMLLDLAPEACFGLEDDGHIVSTATLVSYGRRLAWVGMVLTHPNYRRRGFARRLMTHAMEYAKNRGIATVKLDATSAGQPLYESFGFRSEQAIERWVREGSVQHVPVAMNSWFYPAAIDIEACGYDRSSLFHRLRARSYAVLEASGYVLCRAGRLHAYLGPCVAQHPCDARHVLATVFEKAPDAGWYWDLLPQNAEAVRIANEFGFARERLLTRMVLGPDLRGREEWIYAISGFELG